MRLWAMLACVIVALLALHPAHAETRVQVLGTWPAGEMVTLHGRQTFYLHLHYSSDKPVHIWARPYFEGKPADADSNPSPTYPAGSGEALGWFFLNDPGAQVDEVRINAGDGSIKDTPVVATYPVSVTGGDEPAQTSSPPAWVSALRATEVGAPDYKPMTPPMSAGDTALVYGFLLAMLALGILGFCWPLWGLWRWRGGWRIAAAVPVAVMAFVVLRLFAHNLWPLELMMWGGFSCLWMLIVGLVHKLSGTGRT